MLSLTPWRLWQRVRRGSLDVPTALRQTRATTGMRRLRTRGALAQRGTSTLTAFDVTEQKDQPLRYCRVSENRIAQHRKGHPPGHRGLDGILFPNLVGRHGGQLLPGQARRQLDPHPLLDRFLPPDIITPWAGRFPRS